MSHYEAVTTGEFTLRRAWPCGKARLLTVCFFFVYKQLRQSHAYFWFICVYLQAEAGGYSRRVNLASQAAGRHTDPGCAVDLKESGASSRHLPHSLSQYQDTSPVIIQTHPPPYRNSSMSIYLRESAAESPTPPFPLTSCLVSDGWTTPHLVSMIWKDMLVKGEHLTKVCDDWMPHIYWS